MFERVEDVFRTQHGIARVTQLHRIWLAYHYRENDEEIDEAESRLLFDAIYKRSLLASLMIMRQNGETWDGIEKRIMERYKLDMPDVLDDKDIEDFKCDLVALLLSYHGEKRCADAIISYLKRLEERYPDEKTNGRNSFIDALDTLVVDKMMDSLQGDVLNYRSEFVLRLNFFLTQAGKWKVAEIMEANYIRSYEYDFASMEAYSRMLAKDYYESSMENEQYMLVANFVRKIDGKFEDYEAVFGLTKNDLLKNLLAVKDEPIVAYRILRGFFDNYTTSNLWLEFVQQNSKVEETIKWCELYDFYARVSIDLEFGMEEEELYQTYGEEFLKFQAYSVNTYTQKLFYNLTNIFNRFIASGYDIEKLLDLLGPNSCAIYSLQFRAQRTIMAEDDIASANQVSKAWLLSIEEPERLLKMYFHTHLHQAVSFRKMLERLATLTNGNISDLMAPYQFKGKVVNIDEYGGFHDLYTIDPVNVWMDNEELWKNINGMYNRGQITEKQKERLCSVLFRTELNAATDDSLSVVRDETVVFRVLGCEKIGGKSYNEALFKVGALEKSQKKEIDRESILDKLADGLKKIQVTHEVSADMLTMEERRAIVQPKNYNRSKEFALLIFDTCMALSEDGKALREFTGFLSKNWYHGINEFYYQPGKSFSWPKIVLSSEERQAIFDKIKGFSQKKLPVALKMTVYMNTIMKTVYYLEHFVSRLWQEKGEESVFQYNSKKEFPYYGFSLQYLSEDADRLYFRFKQNYASIYGKKIFITKKDALERFVLKDENGQNVEVYPKGALALIRKSNGLFGDIKYISRSDKSIELYRLIPAQTYERDEYTLYEAELEGIYRSKWNLSKLREKIAHLIQRNVDLSIGGRFEKVLRRTNSYILKNKYDLDFILALLASWEADSAFNNSELYSTLQKQTIERIRETYENLVTKNLALYEKDTEEQPLVSREQTIQDLQTIYKQSYFQYFVTEDEMKRLVV